MIDDSIRKIADAVLYEGYVLWPYRRSAGKNQKRWTIGAILPRAFSATSGTYDPWVVRTRFLVVGPSPTIQVRLRFLQVVERRVGRRGPDGDLELLDELRVGGARYLS